MRLALPLAAALALAAGAATARAQDGDPVARAKAEMARLDYDAAIALLEQAEESGTNGPAEMIEIYRATAESHAAMGRADAAETAFRRLLALDPSFELPAGSSPTRTGPFGGAREFLADRRIAIECRRAGAATLVVKSDPVDLVAGGRPVTASGEPAGKDARGQGRVTLAVEAGGPVAGCAALDRHGNVLVRADLTETSEEVAPAGPAAGPSTAVVAPAPAEGGGRPIYARWWLYAGLAGGAGAVALYYGLEMKKAEDDLQALDEETMRPEHDVTYAEWLAVEDRGERAARNANIALVVTGVFAAVSGGLLVHQLVTTGEEREPAPRSERSPPERDARSNRMTPWALGAAPLPGGGAVNLTLGF